MNLQYAAFDTGSGGQAEHYSGPPGPIGNAEHIAMGAFDGSEGLPPDLTVLNSLADFESYVAQLEAKTTQISSDPLGINLFNIYVQYVVLGGTGADVVTADGTVTADGLLVGRGGDDSLQGGAGHNTLEGGAGNDTLVSGGTGDKLLGGPGADRIEFTDFADYAAAHLGALGAGDRVDFSAVAASHGFSAFLVVSHFDGHAVEAEVVYHAHHDDTAFLFDIDGNGVADAKVTVRGGDYTDLTNFTGIGHPGAIGPDASLTAPVHGHAAAVDAHALVV